MPARCCTPPPRAGRLRIPWESQYPVGRPVALRGAATDSPALAPADAILADLDALTAGATTAADATAAITPISRSRRPARSTRAAISGRAPISRRCRSAKASGSTTACAPRTISRRSAARPGAGGGGRRRGARRQSDRADGATRHRGDRLLAAKEGILDLRASVGSLQETVERAKAERVSERETLDLARTKIVATDPLEAASAYQMLQQQLEVDLHGDIAAGQPALRSTSCGSRMAFRPLGLVLALLLLWFGGLFTAGFASPARIKDLVEVDGVRGNDLLGYGLVVGLNNTGDSLRNSPFTEDAIVNLLERLGRQRDRRADPGAERRGGAGDRGVAALRPRRQPGRRDGLGDRRRESLLGGTLVMTPLNAADGQIYAVAQGSIIAGGIVAEGQAESVTQGVPTAGLIPSGAAGRARGRLRFHPGARRCGWRSATPTSPPRRGSRRRSTGTSGPASRGCSIPGTVRLDLAGVGVDEPARLMAQIENIEVETSTKARVVVDQRSGTIILGSDVRISRVAVTQGNLTLRVEEAPLVVQPNPFADGPDRGDPAHRRLDRGGAGDRSRDRRQFGVAAARWSRG